MAMKKIALSLPQPVLEQVDRLAASPGESRSHLIATGAGLRATRQTRP